MKIKDILKISNGILYSGNIEECFNFSIDTRTLKKDDAFIGIKGDNFNGNLLYKEAFKKGALLCILEKNSFDYIKDENLNIILVDNTITFLKDLATFIRNNLKTDIIGVTGSVGKTTNKELIYEVLKEKYKVFKTEKNLNGKIGIPLMITKIKDEEIAIIEMGVDEIGGMDYLVDIVKPNNIVITNIDSSHIEKFKKRKNILKEKIKIKKYINDGFILINNDNDLLNKYFKKNNVYKVGINNKGTVIAKNIKFLEDKMTFDIVYNEKIYKVNTSVRSKDYIYNFLTCFLIGIIYKIDVNKIIKVIENFKTKNNRLEYIYLKNITVINDSYNASFDSVRLALDILGTENKRKIAVLGDMLELGKKSKKYHKKLSKYIKLNKIDILITVGKNSKIIKNKYGIKYSLDSIVEANSLLLSIIKEGDIILFKASNSMNFKKLVDDFVKKCYF